MLKHLINQVKNDTISISSDKGSIIKKWKFSGTGGLTYTKFNNTYSFANEYYEITDYYISIWYNHFGFFHANGVSNSCKLVFNYTSFYLNC
jgi:hypothetical protein